MTPKQLVNSLKRIVYQMLGGSCNPRVVSLFSVLGKDFDDRLSTDSPRKYVCVAFWVSGTGLGYGDSSEWHLQFVPSRSQAWTEASACARSFLERTCVMKEVSGCEYMWLVRESLRNQQWFSPPALGQRHLRIFKVEKFKIVEG